MGRRWEKSWVPVKEISKKYSFNLKINLRDTGEEMEQKDLCIENRNEEADDSLILSDTEMLPDLVDSDKEGQDDKCSR